MKQGAFRHAYFERGDDLYETPAVAVRALLRHQPLPKRIWEPCAGRGAIARELREAGHEVITQDLVAYAGADPGILTPVDFLLEPKAPEGVRCVVTNPPYKLADQCIRHGLALGCDVIVLLRLMAIEGAGRSDLMDTHCVRIWAGIERLPTMHREGWAGPKITNSGAPFAWFFFSASPRPFGEPVALRRVSWRLP